eukprot:scaffold6753_cov49-Phaeocystis_antarctica.AAC.2
MPEALRADVTRVEGFIQDYALPPCYRRAIVVSKHVRVRIRVRARVRVRAKVRARAIVVSKHLQRP